MLVDFSDGMKLDGESNPILVDLSDEKKQPWMFTLDGLILWTASFLGRLPLERRPHSILNTGRRPLGRRPHSLNGGPLNGGLIPNSLDGGPLDGAPWTAASFLGRRPLERRPLERRPHSSFL